MESLVSGGCGVHSAIVQGLTISSKCTQHARCGAPRKPHAGPSRRGELEYEWCKSRTIQPSHRQRVMRLATNREWGEACWSVTGRQRVCQWPSSLRTVAAFSDQTSCATHRWRLWAVRRAYDINIATAHNSSAVHEDYSDTHTRGRCGSNSAPRAAIVSDPLPPKTMSLLICDNTCSTPYIAE